MHRGNDIRLQGTAVENTPQLLWILEEDENEDEKCTKCIKCTKWTHGDTKNDNLTVQKVGLVSALKTQACL